MNNMEPERNTVKGKFEAVVVGASAGGIEALSKLLDGIPSGYPLPLIVVQHAHPSQDGTMFEHFNKRCRLAVQEAGDKEAVMEGHVYFAPPDYHLLVERDRTFSLSIDGKVNYSRPSIDVLFESAARVWLGRLVGIILTGANNDGAAGMRLIKEQGGLTIAQDPATAERSEMPQAAIDTGAVDRVLTLEDIGSLLQEFS